MVTEVVMTVWIRLEQGSEKVKDQDMDEAHGKSEGVYSKDGVHRDCWLVESLTSHFTHYRSYWRRLSQSITWQVLAKLSQTTTKYN